MFVYQNKQNTQVYINIDVDYPKSCPDYILAIDNGVLKVNDLEVNRIKNISIEPELDVSKPFEISTPSFIDLSGKKITATADTVGDGVFHVTVGGVLTIDGDGYINSVGNNEYSMAVWADGGKVIINNGNFTNVGAGSNDHYDLIYVKNNGVVEINGGYFECQTPRWTLNSNNSAPGTIIVKGGSFKNYNPAESYTDENGSNPTNFVAPGYAVKRDGDIYTVYKI